MTSEGLGEMFEGDSADTRKISAQVDGGPSGRSSVRKLGSEEPHRRERKLTKLVSTKGVKKETKSDHNVLYCNFILTYKKESRSV